MRTVSKHQSPMERQVVESVNINLASSKPAECLNLKSEWGMSKSPSLQVETPKGVSRNKDSDIWTDWREHGSQVDQEVMADRILEESLRRGVKRMRYREGCSDQDQDPEADQDEDE